MSPLSPRDRRTLRLAAIGVAVYLTLFYGAQGLRRLEERRDAVAGLEAELAGVETELLRQRSAERRLEALSARFGFDPLSLEADTAVSTAREGIARLAGQSQVALATVREVPGRASRGEAIQIQLSGLGPTVGVATFIHGLRELPAPVVVERLRFERQGLPPGQMSFSVQVSLLDFETWKGSRAKRPR